jgi:hypothetical protein
MTRFAWLQTRTQTLATLAMLAALAVAAAITGVQLSHLYGSLVAHCQTGCDLALNRFLSRDSFMNNTLDILARVVPPLLGIFWGAPLLARELENGTHRLAWTQSVSRSRWLLTKLAVGTAVTALVAVGVTLTITWWSRAVDKAGTIPFAVFDRRDIAPIAYAIFAFASGALLGAVVRRTVPAMAATLGVFVFARVAIGTWLRPHLLTPLHLTKSLLGVGPQSGGEFGIGRSNGGPIQLFVKGSGPPNSWSLSSHLVTSSGHQVSGSQMSAFLHQYCPNVGLQPPPPVKGGGVARVIGPSAGQDCLDHVAKTYKLFVSYQPNGRYWIFQWMEAGIFVVLAALCIAACYWWVTRRA